MTLHRPTPRSVPAVCRAFVLAFFCSLFLSCTSGPRSITVGSKNFTEQLIVGEMTAQHLERRLNQPVTRRLNLGGTLLAHQALLQGDIDLYPEYTGTALTSVLKQPPQQDSSQVFQTVRQLYRDRFQVELLDPLGYDNSFAMVVRAGLAAQHNLETLSDAERVPGWIIGHGYEFLDRPDGWPALRARYQLKQSAPPKAMDLGLLYRALETGQVTMAAGSATDGLLSVLPVKVLRDDRRAFPPYEAALLVRQAALAREPRLRAALAELSHRLDAPTMRRLNYEVDGRKRPLRDVAADFLRTW